MAIIPVNTGVRAYATYSAATSLSWTLNVAPTAGNAVIIPFSYNNCAVNTLPTSFSISDNQGNTWVLASSSSNTGMLSGYSATYAAVWVCYNVVSSGGAFTVTIAESGMGGRQSFTANHIEVSGLGSLDQIGTYSSGGSLVYSSAATAGGANSNPYDLVVAVLATSSQSGTAGGSDPPASGYTSLGSRSWYDNAGLTQAGYGEAAYKILSGSETSSATWSGWANDAFASAVIVTFAPTATSITLPLTGAVSNTTAGVILSSGAFPSAMPMGRPLISGPGVSPDFRQMFIGAQTRLSTTFQASNISLALTGQQAQFATGTVGFSLGGNVTLALTGQSILTVAGNAGVTSGQNLTLALTGASAMFSTGSLLVTTITTVLPTLQTSGTFGKVFWDTRTVIDRAYGALRLKPQQITSEMIQIALDVLGLVLGDLVNDAAPLWTTEKVLMTLNQGQRLYTLPNATNDVEKAYYRTLNNVTPATVTSNSRSYVFDFGVGSGAYISSASVEWAYSGLPVLLQSSPDGVNWSTVGKSGLTQLGAGTVWYDVDVTNAQRFWQIIPVGSQTLNITSASLYNTPNDIEMYRLNKDDYYAMPNKDFQGRPLQYWLDRQLNPVMNLWPSPNLNASQNLMVVYRKRYIMDVGSLQQTVEVPTRWYLPIIFKLADALSWCTPEADPTVCEQVRMKSDQMMRRVWSEERDRSPVRFDADISQYTR